ncbi:hypothetical protein GCM10010439_23080 [Actinocorallia aurantiaca]|uniref:Uncharacterized protein n=1 Tax=Actinocorallia aurantiaca TaxID=46204 RepID=A0ABP6GLL8_9ACTN
MSQPPFVPPVVSSSCDVSPCRGGEVPDGGEDTFVSGHGPAPLGLLLLIEALASAGPVAQAPAGAGG